MGGFFISVTELSDRVGTADAPFLFDVRRRPVFDAGDRVVPGARWRDHRETAAWATEVPAGAEVVVYCVHGHNVSQMAAARLGAAGVNARTLEGGIE
ncbi:MAG: rhodanese-like domain-containing protein, partial [Alphaproteobacteria bacterium]